MACAGLFLIVFLLVHLGINLCLLRSDPTWFNDASHFMGANYVVKVLEICSFRRMDTSYCLWCFSNSQELGITSNRLL